MSNVFTIAKPEKPLPLIFDSPHSGTIYPADFNYACSFELLENAEDKFVDELFASAPDYGANLLCASFPRSYIDPNRSIDDIDKELLNEEWPDNNINPTARSIAGIGLIRRIVKPGAPVYERNLTPAEIKNRINHYYTPYHDELQALINAAHYNFGQVWHINCHSMPNSTATPRRPFAVVGNKSKPADFVIGNRDSATAAQDFTHMIRDCVKNMGYNVCINDPFKGVEIITRHGDPARGRHSIQLEINKALYMDEDTNKKSSKYSALQNDLNKLIQECAQFVQSNLTTLAAD